MNKKIKVQQKIFELVCCYDFVKDTIEDGKIDIENLKDKIRNEMMIPNEYQVNKQCDEIIKTYNAIIMLFTEDELYQLWDMFYSDNYDKSMLEL